jgi:Cu/Ag efflux pump CusA
MNKKRLVSFLLSIALILVLLFFLDLKEIAEKIALFGLVPLFAGNLFHGGIFFLGQSNGRKSLSLSLRSRSRKPFTFF